MNRRNQIQINPSANRITGDGRPPLSTTYQRRSSVDIRAPIVARETVATAAATTTAVSSSSCNNDPNNSRPVRVQNLRNANSGSLDDLLSSSSSSTEKLTSPESKEPPASTCNRAPETGTVFPAQNNQQSFTSRPSYDQFSTKAPPVAQNNTSATPFAQYGTNYATSDARYGTNIASSAQCGASATPFGQYYGNCGANYYTPTVQPSTNIVDQYGTNARTVGQYSTSAAQAAPYSISAGPAAQYSTNATSPDQFSSTNVIPIPVNGKYPSDMPTNQYSTVPTSQLSANGTLTSNTSPPASGYGKCIDVPPPPPPPPPPPAPPVRVCLAKSASIAGDEGNVDLGSAIQNAQLRKSPKPEDDARFNRPRSGSLCLQSDIMSEMAKKLQERKAKAEVVGTGSSSALQEPGNLSERRPLNLGLPDRSRSPSPFQTPSNVTKPHPSDSSQLPRSRRIQSLTGQENTGLPFASAAAAGSTGSGNASSHGNFATSAELEAVKQELMNVMRTEIAKAKQEIIEAIRLQLQGVLASKAGKT